MPMVPISPSARIHSWVSAYLSSSGTSIAFCIAVFFRQSRQIFAREHLFQLFDPDSKMERRHSQDRFLSRDWEIECRWLTLPLSPRRRTRCSGLAAEEIFHPP